jgi:glucose-1-phosphate thymidylyltransferase
LQSELGDNIKGILLAGGLGTRLHPLTVVASKQLLPIFDKPLVYYPLATLMLANIREIAIISSPDQKNGYINLLGHGQNFGIELTYLTQDKPTGIAESLIIAEGFLEGTKSCLILGDNVFHGAGLGRKLATFSEIEGARVFGYHVNNPEFYGIASLDSTGQVLEIIEKPQNSDSKVAIPGIYFFDEKASKLAKTIKRSARGELEIVDLLKLYLQSNSLQLEMLPRGTAWFDSGTFNDMHDASTYVRLMQERTGERVGDPKEVGRIRGWISKE